MGNLIISFLRIIFLIVIFDVSLLQCNPFWQTNSEEAEEIGDQCTTEGYIGICQRTDDCKFGREEFSTQGQRLIRDKCGFENNDEIVICCPIEPESVNARSSFDVTPGKKSEAACKNFTKQLAIRYNVVNGEGADLLEFPHMAAIGYEKERTGAIEFNCGGSLISEKFVLTAGHCISKSQVPKIVRLGRTSLVDSEHDLYEELDVTVKNAIKHPKYISSQKYHDIALLELKEKVNFSPNILPACLFTNKKDERRNLTVSGWGRNSQKNALQRPTWLQKAEIGEILYHDCVDAYKGKEIVRRGLPTGIWKTHLCAYNKTSKADACNGDSGGPIQLKQNSKYYIVGITSFGIGCGSDLPAFYTRVASYLGWIESIVWP